MSSETGPVAVDPTLRRRIEPHEFEVFFDPRELRKETCLLYEINWGGRHSVWRHTSQNTSNHVEVNFLEKFTTERYFRPNTRCSITWFLSWSPCGECSRAITEFLSRHPYVTLFIYIARLYHHTDQRNRQGLRDLISSGVTIQIMTEQEYCYCWRNFVNYPPSNEAYWPRYPHLWVKLYVLELYCIILGLPPCLKILRRKQPQLTFFTITLQTCHYQRIPPHLLWATGLK
ncbi:C-_U-editing enzyme APOBEC-1 isoform a [Mus musculus]|uniref:C->U-editing enzyme APOBEC-1 n=4 Tax=Mus musculus TaxID=10090 RepID=ABEC1_MOUSE|nr:C->U-editing enzyme APOBEC-1 isoform a [Mus musculus]NP_001396396.1 C->U-editing enzyme APOBEC-1 isoform a [Mus musculus]NP_001396397.1 C->U-editing enzyme APOBEC-1 isoform a [Mus musculus]NP_001396398.1 C->U-editing enzyme APOBEC-1 isoform a [Mus musculus]NP_001396399.1 C->U-editing enzyme APOBEC-1 isoform a [Mus musculus]NP_112436.1 C->U-editing enzyme APOBEC-1 isoform a [Mus musculus]P51908.1 RecName: Full=C->U-editing enzyme APOBEC-1; AltName: Full=Apolipoprotein B mRNA-editing enzyme |eukprot:NP_001127863.1 C-_U-editing enzyme APOBEC-1 [Mus musculus]